MWSEVILGDVSLHYALMSATMTILGFWVNCSSCLQPLNHIQNLVCGCEAGLEPQQRLRRPGTTRIRFEGL